MRFYVLQKMKIRLLCYLALLATCQTGCIIIPVPHPTERSPSLQGRVIDSNNNPIQGARIELQNKNAHRRSGTEALIMSGAHTTTGSDGYFSLWPRYNAHLFYYINPSFDFHWPGGSYWNGQLNINSERFKSQTFKIGENKSGQIGDLILTTKKPITQQ